MDNNQLVTEKISKTTNIESLKVDDQDVVDNTEIAQSMNKFFCSVGEKHSDDIPRQLNPFLSNEYVVNQPRTLFRFETDSSVGAERALKQMKISFGFGSDGIASHFLKIAFTVISKCGATRWTGVDMSTPLSSGRYLFLSKNDIKTLGIPTGDQFTSCPPHFFKAGAAPARASEAWQKAWKGRKSLEAPG